MTKHLYLLLALTLFITSCSSSIKQENTNKSPSQIQNQQEIDVESQSTGLSSKKYTRIIEGTGQFISQSNYQSLSLVTDQNGTNLNFIDTDARTIIDAVIGDVLEKPYTISSSVKGNITLQSNEPLDNNSLLYALEAALRTINIAMLRQGDSFNFVPVRNAPQHANAISIKRPATIGLPGFGVQAIQLSFISPSEMTKILEPFSQQDNILRADNARNMILVAGTAQERTRILEVVETFDVDWMKGMSFAMYHLQHVEAKTIQNELMRIFNEQSTPIAGLIRFIPLPRLNAILALSPQKKYLHDVESWISRLDINSESGGRRIYVYHIQNGKADNIASVLNQVITGDTNTNEATGSQNSGASSSSTSSFFASGTLKIVPNEDNNSLLILASPEEYSVVSSALKKIDTMPRQVFIEASLAEVTLTDELRYGVQWFFEDGESTFTLSEATSGATSSSFPGFSYVFSGTSSRAVLNALDSITDVNVISSPKLMVLNNQSATIQVGDQVPVATQAAQGTSDASARLVNTVEFRDTGVILSVTPRVNKGGLVLLEVAQEVSDVAETTSSGIDSPTIQQRKINSTVAVQNGQTIALGGLIRENKTRVETGLPILSKVPFFGSLFGSTDNTTRRTELVILITPRVLTDDSEANELLEQLKADFTYLKPKMLN